MSLRSIEFHFVEAMTNIRRNGLMSISAVTNSAACLFVLGAFLVGWWNLARLHQRVASETRVLVFMRRGVPVEQAETTAQSLSERVPGVIRSYKIVTPEEALVRVCQRVCASGPLCRPPSRLSSPGPRNTAWWWRPQATRSWLTKCEPVRRSLRT